MLLAAPRAFHPDGWRYDYVLDFAADGTVRDFRPERPADRPRRLDGTLLPGLVNAHCHLELSALRGKIPPGSGMVPFVTEVVRLRGEISEAEHKAAIRKALDESRGYGTVLTGDIAGTDWTVAAKREATDQAFHTFVELLGLRGDAAGETAKRGRELARRFEPNASLTLHAPYSVAPELRELVLGEETGRLSIHLLESAAERELFAQRSGPFLDFFARLGLRADAIFAELSAREVDTPQAYLLAGLDPKRPVLFVHLTEATPEELAALAERFPNAFFCLCPRSNFYLHRKMPAYEGFAPYLDRCCLGTDSLASNTSLDVRAEMRALLNAWPALDRHRAARMATLQGAAALGREAEFGAFREGTRPGWVLWRD